MPQKYQIIVHEPLPSDLKARIAALHASAILQSGHLNKSTPVAESNGQNYDVTQKGKLGQSLKCANRTTQCIQS